MSKLTTALLAINGTFLVVNLFVGNTLGIIINLLTIGILIYFN
jgi:hypothetical protein